MMIMTDGGDVTVTLSGPRVKNPSLYNPPFRSACARPSDVQLVTRTMKCVIGAVVCRWLLGLEWPFQAQSGVELRYHLVPGDVLLAYMVNVYTTSYGGLYCSFSLPTIYIATLPPPFPPQTALRTHLALPSALGAEKKKRLLPPSHKGHAHIIRFCGIKVASRSCGEAILQCRARAGLPHYNDVTQVPYMLSSIARK